MNTSETDRQEGTDPLNKEAYNNNNTYIAPISILLFSLALKNKNIKKINKIKNK